MMPDRDPRWYVRTLPPKTFRSKPQLREMPALAAKARDTRGLPRSGQGRPQPSAGAAAAAAYAHTSRRRRRRLHVVCPLYA